ncbi:MAG: DUF2294 family protein [Chloroflexi bacterium]|nr:MAG: DUF2294 family protein [Chloroflexota bacterium]
MTQLAQADNQTLAKISKGLLTAWQQNHGAQDGKVYAIKGSSCILVFIEDAFTKAEMHLAEQDNGNNQTLNRYVQSLLAHICYEQKGFVAQQLDARVVSTSVSADTVAGWAMCIFKLTDS